jgi:hypothetical protein
VPARCLSSTKHPTDACVWPALKPADPSLLHARTNQVLLLANGSMSYKLDTVAANAVTTTATEQPNRLQKRSSTTKPPLPLDTFLLPTLTNDKLSHASPYPILPSRRSLEPLPLLNPSARDFKPSENAPFPPNDPRPPLYASHSPQPEASTSKTVLATQGDLPLMPLSNRPDVRFSARLLLCF